MSNEGDPSNTVVFWHKPTGEDMKNALKAGNIGEALSLGIQVFKETIHPESGQTIVKDGKKIHYGHTPER